MSLSHLEAAFKADIPMKHKLTLVVLIMSGGVKHNYQGCELAPDLSVEGVNESLQFLLEHGFIEETSGGVNPVYEKRHFKLKDKGQ